MNEPASVESGGATNSTCRAAEIESVARAAYLDWACANDPVLRARMEKLVGRQQFVPTDSQQGPE